MGLLELTVILSAYNSGSFIVDSVTRLSEYLDPTGLSYEIIVVNDGSTDDTLERLRMLENSRLSICNLPHNQGRGAAIKRGMEVTNGRYIITTDADIPFGPASVLKCYRALSEGAPFVIGDRTLPQCDSNPRVPITRRIMSSISQRMVTFLLPNSGIIDTQCGLKGFDMSFAKQVRLNCRMNRFAFDLDVIVFAIENRIPIVRLPVVLETSTKSSVRVIRDSIDSLWGFCLIAQKKWRGRYTLAPCSQSSQIKK